MRRVIVLSLALLLAPAMPARAALINIGLLSFDEFIPSDGEQPGVNAFNVLNLTGDFALPGDFPIVSPIVFTTSTLSVVADPLGDIGPGLFEPQTEGLLYFTALAQFSSATFSAQLGSLVFTLADGTVWEALSPEIIATLLPTTGSFLETGQSVLLTVDAVQQSVPPPPPNPVPEPQTWLLLGTGITALAGLRRGGNDSSPRLARGARVPRSLAR